MRLSNIALAISALYGGLFTPAGLFAGGVNGVWYDPSDLTTLFTDSAGTTPVTAVEQFVGLMLDKRVPVAQTGYYSGVFDGSNDSLTLGTVSSFNFMHNPTALFTFECWVNVSSTASQLCIADNTSGTTAQTGFFVRILAGGAISLAITNSNGVSPSIVGGTSTSTISTNTWTHIAITYDHSLASANAKFYINGVAAGTSNKTAATPSSGNASQILLIGRFNGGGGEFNGYISNLRITNNIVYTGAFTPPTIPLTAVANTQLLTCQNSTFIDNSPNNFAITAGGGIVAGAANPFGNHATSTGTKRPKLAARYNLLTYTEQFDNAAWTKSNAAVTANSVAAPDGTTTADKLIENNGVNRGVIYQLAPQTGQVFSVFAKAAEWNRVAIGFTNGAGLWGMQVFNLSTGALDGTASYGGTTFTNPTITPVGSGWYRCAVTANSVTSTLCAIMPFNQSGDPVNPSPALVGDGTSGIYIWGADLRPASQATGLIGPTYQRVVDAATYDTAGFLPYLQFDGIDDSMSTGSIDATAVDKAQVFAGARRLANALDEAIAEFSASWNLNNGTFIFSNIAASSAYGFDARGTANGLNSVNNYAPPRTNVRTGLLDLGANVSIQRVNGTQVSNPAVNFGGGNFGNYPLFVGARNNVSIYFNGWLTSLIVRFGATLSQSQIEATESWVAGKTGVSL